MTSSAKRALVALDEPANAEALVIDTSAVRDEMTNHPSLSQPFPALAKVFAAAERSKTPGRMP